MKPFGMGCSRLMPEAEPPLMKPGQRWILYRATVIGRTSPRAGKAYDAWLLPWLARPFQRLQQRRNARKGIA